MSRTLAVYVVPDTRMARDAGLDLHAAGLEIAVTPRHASVLLVVGDLTAGLSVAAAVVYAQMPRPRAILTLGSDTTASLPPADAVMTLDQTGLVEGMEHIRAMFEMDAWSATAEPFTAAVLEVACGDNSAHDRSGHGGHNEHEMVAASEEHAGHGDHQPSSHDVPSHNGHAGTQGQEPHDQHASHGPHAGMEHSEEPAHAHDDTHANHDHSSRHTGSSQDAHTDSSHDAHADRIHDAPASIEHDAMGHDMMDHGAMGHDMSGHDHHMMDGGFMSMVAMTRDLPRSRDGMPMEWTETAFGPLFDGLPAGLAAKLTLDGDTVAAATLDTGRVHRGIVALLPGPATSLPDRLALLDPLAPVAYRVLAAKALATLQSSGTPAALDRSTIGALERERVASHLAWLAGFLNLLGMTTLARRAARLHLAAIQAPDIAAMHSLRSSIERMTRGVARTPMLARRTAGIGQLDPAAAHEASGPVTRASGRSADTRSESAAYRALGFEPVTRESGDASARLQTRLVEIRRSLDLIEASGTIAVALPDVSSHLSGSGMATVETPRGTASLHVVVHHGEVHEAHPGTPSSAHRGLVPIVTEQAELADALVAIASLDLSPWEIDQ